MSTVPKCSRSRASSRAGALHALQEGFTQEHGLQCGYCTPGMITRAYRLLKENPNPTEEEIRYWMAGNLCRCTGYQNIVKAVQHAASKLASASAWIDRDLSGETQHGCLNGDSSSAKPSFRDWEARGCARRTPASFAARAPTSMTSNCRACCSEPWCAVPTRTPASSRSTRPRRWPCRVSLRC